RGLVGLASCTSAFVCGMQNGKLQFYGGSEPSPDLSENLRTALIEAIDRWKPLVINQEAVDEQGKARIVRSTLVHPIPGAQGRDALLFRRDDSPMVVGTDELEIIAVYANLARLLLDRRELSRRDLAGRLGFDAVIQLLRGADRPVAFDDDPGFFLRQIGEILPESSLAVTFVRNSAGVLQAKAGFRTNIDELEDIDIHPGEGSIGEAGVTGQPQFVCGRREAQNALELYEPSVKSAFQRQFGERGIPSFIAACPLVDAEHVRAVATLFLFNVSDTDAPSWTKLLTLASGLYSFRLTVSSLQSLSRTASAATSDRNDLLPIVNKLNNHLSAVIGTAELAGQRVDIAGDLRSQLKSIIDEAQRAASVARSAVAAGFSRSDIPPAAVDTDFIRDAVESVLAKARISGNLYMAGGRPREITCSFDSAAPLLFSSENVRSLFEAVLDRFATYTADDDVISLVSYRNDKFVFLDLCRHRKNFPPVERVMHFGEYQTAEQAFRNRPADVYLRQISESPCWYAVDTAAPSPAFLSFKFPIRDGGSRSSISGARTAIRILAIDDQPVILDLISAMCQSLGYQIVTAGSGEEGTRLASQGHFDIVLTDLAMPDISGLEVARRIRKIQPDIPIILVTGWEATLDKAQLGAAGVTDVLYKPFRIEQLTDLVQAAAVKRS
ncbi:MAG TPA: response regulator, partial [Candidatus Acidoferrum sp.]|nr:response regulator [Candidatus Acidoferrum sp.]